MKAARQHRVRLSSAAIVLLKAIVLLEALPREAAQNIPVSRRAPRAAAQQKRRWRCFCA
jgi:hypothetical protein